MCRMLEDLLKRFREDRMRVLYLILAFCLLMGSFFFIFYSISGGLSCIEKEIIEIDEKINTTLRGNEYINWTALQKREYRDDVFKKMIDWGIQRQLHWAVMILTFLTLFFMVLFEIRQAILQDRIGKTYIVLLAFGGVIFSISAFISIYMSIRHYYHVAYLEDRLLFHPIESPLTSLISPLPILIFLVNTAIIMLCLVRAFRQ